MKFSIFLCDDLIMKFIVVAISEKLESEVLKKTKIFIDQFSFINLTNKLTCLRIALKGTHDLNLK